MRVTKLHYRRTKQVQPYEPVTIELEIELLETENVIEAYTRAEATVRRMLGEVPTAEEVEEAKALLRQSETSGF